MNHNNDALSVMESMPVLNILSGPVFSKAPLEYIYYIWQCSDKHPAYISIFEVVFDDGTCECCGQIRYEKDDSKCIFVGEPEKLLEKYDKERN